MGNAGNKLNYHDAVQQLRTNKNTPKSFKDEFWRQFWPDNQLVELNDLYTMISAAELRSIREDIPHNFAQLVIYCSEQLINCSTTTFCNTTSQQNVALNCCHLLIRVIPYAFEDEDFAKILWSEISLEDENEEVQNNEKPPKEPASPRNFKQQRSNNFKEDSDDTDTEDEDERDEENNQFANSQYGGYKKPLAIKLINAVCDLLFAPEFTVVPAKLSNKGSKSKSSGKCLQTISLN